MSNNVWLTSDFHFGHDREFIWKVRGFASVKDMNETIVRNINLQVGNEDDLYILGDVCLGDDSNFDYLSRLNGRIHLVRGNHDTDARWAAYKQMPNVVEMADAIYMKYEKMRIYLSHFPTFTGNLENENLHQMTINFYGHTHQKTKFFEDRPYMYHIGVDSNYCWPVSLHSALFEMKRKIEECKSFL